MIYNISPNNNSNLTNFYKAAINDLNLFYELNWVYNTPFVFVLNTKEDVIRCKKDMGLSRFKGATGWVGNRGVYVVSKEIYKELKNPENLEEEYFMLIKHELSHLFFQHTSQFCSRPDWLWEGCAVYLSGQNKYLIKPEKFSTFLKFFEQDTNGNVYKESGFAVQLLIEKFGKNKLINLIKKLRNASSQKCFKQLFKNTYKIELVYKEFNNLWSSLN